MAATTLVALTTVLLSGALSLVNAETHTVRFDNQYVLARFAT
jgi:hypothetical protein